MHQQTAALVAWPRGDGAEVSMVDAFRDANGELLGRRLSRAELGGERRGSASGSFLSPGCLPLAHSHVAGLVARSQCGIRGNTTTARHGDASCAPTTTQPAGTSPEDASRAKFTTHNFWLGGDRQPPREKNAFRSERSRSACGRLPSSMHPRACTPATPYV